ncbi:phospholipid/cholesterol/gamma-HCH transport system substrate-binding protein [Marinospirillum celere]|uniref:Phospholipid/cholesterol/gamma-HCH transport system substrate-binding protein n=1 Tax=Marinospirillum celere TaxID=1122252 RepID=A0A1I1EFJ3_9GAMM|nr:MlaD family protein [Marinospirillum celere]SFB85871.1 phospholipid/cholesterol/gamma-HCH transport system substrate-binding protein [Marinospirillum celere]
MNPRINYTLVGAFVVVLILAGLGIASWMTHESRSTDRLPYVTYFYDSVSGLNERAQVKYRGVPIGYVDKISLVNDPNERVELRLMLDANAPIRSDTFSTLQHQGVTGLLFVELQSSNSRGTRLVTSRDNPAEIPSRASRLVQFTDSLDELSDKLGSLLQSFNRVSDQLEMMTNPEMREQILGLMQASQQLATTAEQRLQEVNPKTYEKLATTLEELTYELTLRARQLPDQLDSLEKGLSRQLETLQLQLQHLSEDTSTSARQLAPTLQQAERLLEQLRLESGSWLRGNQIQPRGPGE